LVISSLGTPAAALAGYQGTRQCRGRYKDSSVLACSMKRGPMPTLKNEAKLGPSEQKQQNEQQQRVTAPSELPSLAVAIPDKAEDQPQDHQNPKQKSNRHDNLLLNSTNQKQYQQNDQDQPDHSYSTMAVSVSVSTTHSRQSSEQEQHDDDQQNDTQHGFTPFFAPFLY
jgi:hypothetical protein